MTGQPALPHEPLGSEPPSGGPGKWPWLEIWIKPRAISRYYLNQPYQFRKLLLLAALGGAVMGLTDASIKPETLDNNPLGLLLFGQLVLGVIGGLIGFYLVSYLVRVAGGWLGGTGDKEDLRTAIVYGFMVPSLVQGILWIPKFLVLGREAWIQKTVAAPFDNTPFMDNYSLFELCIAVWAIVVFVKAVAEAHRFSAWRSLGAVLLSLALFFVAAIIIIFFITLLFSVFI
ncbi:Yip1 family protein [Paenibacillus protaetiae]|uniref:YIP1 family protein n=1 Tax=Paenibacillus protaetiae TaxID=2509456 RepID=A0A4P6EXY1_9BACL|nr:Yip1 family protein [Paenibacillus protaetiae]QAY67676.1 YIP1 family protein [Paenibacillus protaetiae]